eukprot:2240761-Alexandrium_andersonii.AAC.1
MCIRDSVGTELQPIALAAGTAVSGEPVGVSVQVTRHEAPVHRDHPCTARSARAPSTRKC